MSASIGMPRAARHLAGFPPFLRAFDFNVSPDQTLSFLAAVELLGPRGIEDVRRAAVATLAPAHERTDDFDALFRAWFHGEMLPAAGDGEDDEVRVRDDGGPRFDPPDGSDADESGEAATTAETLAVRRFDADVERHRLRRFARDAPSRLPKRRGFRRARARSGERIDLRRALRAAVRQGGDTPELPWRRRRHRHRRILLLVDISGSMKAETESMLRFAHALYHAAERLECFTLGTRLTRVTGALKLKHRERALERAAALVADWDGGTRLGDALGAFLSVPRFAGYARGAFVVVLSDGLERGSPDAMIEAVTHLSRLAWRLHWLTPLAGDDSFRPQTRALAAVAPLLDDLGDGASLEALCRHVLASGGRTRRGRAA